MSRLYLFALLVFVYQNGFAQRIETRPISDETLKQFKTSGTLLLKKIEFKDKNGLNYVIAAMEEAAKDDYNSRTLWIEHYVKGTTKTLKLLKEVVDFEKDCPVDNQLALIDEAFEVTDLDKNGYAEIMFMYKTGCKGDLSPSGLKLIVLQNGKKAAIRGKSLIKGFKNTDEKQQDAAFLALPQVIRQHADNLWNRFKTEYE
ncbi:M949_RS01915 family surface polysaccharide biosynthesis protein [Emticicia fluvialis]|uniref:M949_RS01915 family surface polysaccharide biosynthesis protein n=1 Tax=Emticicia fluvialis TaxID=2974474 RepID=UPI0021659462|nr:hypothetical protein [Emticicia fluvialis]